MAKHTTYTCDICGKDISEEAALSANKHICMSPGFWTTAARYMKITVEEGDCGMWYTLDICTACRKKIVNYIECMKEKKGNEELIERLKITEQMLNVAHFKEAESLIREAYDAIEELQSKQPERKKGKWIKQDNGTYVCNLCQSWIPNEQRYYANYCLFCGVEMEKTDG